MHETKAWEEMGFAQREYLQRRAARLEGWIGFWMGEERGPRILEIGGAGMPAVDFIDGFAERHAVDPLMDEYVRMFGDMDLGRDVQRQQVCAEDMPFPDGHFDAVLMLNVLDHVQSPDLVLAEVNRVLDPERGFLFMSCDTYSRGWLLLRLARVALRGKRNNDILHPHHFTLPTLVETCQRQFDILEVCNRHGDPLADEHVARTPYPFGGPRNRLKCEGRVYLAARPITD